MSRADRLAHLGGYAAIAAVLASANWAGILGMLLGGAFVLLVVGYAALVGYDVLTSRVRAEAADVVGDDPTPETGDAVATDGGRLEYRQDLPRRGARLWLRNDDLTQAEVAEALSDDEVEVSRTALSRAVNHVSVAEEVAR
jgi:hypothetical protein